MPTDYVRFIEHYQALHAYKTRSRVIQEALELLRRTGSRHFLPPFQLIGYD